MTNKFTSLDYILNQGSIVHDIISIIVISLGVNFLTSILMEQEGTLYSSIVGVISSSTLIISGIYFSWLSYWIRVYMEISKNSIDDAAQKIRNEKKEVKFKSKANSAYLWLLVALFCFIIKGRV